MSNKFYDVEFESVVNKGELFTFKELFEIQDNQKKFDRFISEQIESEKEMIKDQLRINIREEYEAKADIAVKEKEVQLKQKYQDENSELKAQLNNIREAKDEQIKTLQEELVNKIEIIKESKDEQIENLKKQLEENRKESKEMLDSINSQVEKRIEDAVARKTEELTAKRKSAVQIGDIGEEAVMEQLRTLFPNDQIVKPEEHSGGADIDQTVMDSGKDLGTILYEIKNKTAWAKKDYQNFVDKVNSSSHDYYIYVHNKVVGQKGEGDFKQITKSLTYDTRNKILITDFDTVIPLIYSLRQAMVKYAKEIEVSKNRSSLAEEMFDFINSDKFTNYFTRIMDKRAESVLHFDKIIDHALKGKDSLSYIEKEVKELLISFGKEA